MSWLSYRLEIFCHISEAFSVVKMIGCGMIKHFHSICWLGHLNSISTKKTKIFQSTSTWCALDILFSPSLSSFNYLSLCKWANEDWSLTVNWWQGDQVQPALHRGLCTSWCISVFQTEFCRNTLGSNNLGSWCMLLSLLRESQYWLIGKMLSKIRWIKRLLKVYSLSFLFPFYSHK